MPDSTNPDILTPEEVDVAFAAMGLTIDPRGIADILRKSDTALRSELERVTKERDEAKQIPDGSHWTAIAHAASLVPDGDVMRLVNVVTSDFIRMRTSRDNATSELTRLKERIEAALHLADQYSGCGKADCDDCDFVRGAIAALKGEG